jgi:hypothetical protein
MDDNRKSAPRSSASSTERLERILLTSAITGSCSPSPNELVNGSDEGELAHNELTHRNFLVLCELVQE